MHSILRFKSNKETKTLNRILRRCVAHITGSERQNFVEGVRCMPKDRGEQFVNLNPGTGKQLGVFYGSSRAELDRAVQSSHDAFADWSQTTASERSQIFRRAARLMRTRKLDLSRMETHDTGKTISESSFDIEAVIDCLNYFAAMCHNLQGQQIPIHTGAFAYTVREPLGVCAGIGAWNFPIQNIAWKALPALACGNTVVYKPSPLTPITSAVFSEILTEVGLPAGCLNVVQGGADVGQFFCQHPEIAKVSFTGSAQTGSKVMAACAPTLKKVTLELGGKSPLIIFDDADIDNAVQGALMANYITQGEVCSNGARVFVHENMFDTFVERVVEATRALRVGDTMNARTHIGALISAQHREHVEGFITRAKAEGARVLVGGDRPDFRGATYENGYFLNPCILGDCHDQMEIVREEHFGPVMSVLSFSTEEEVIRRANDTPTGLAAGVFTNNISRAHRMIRQLEAGSCCVNTYNMYPVQIPFGGNKMSGIGRENGTQVLEHYTQTKSVYIELNEVDSMFK